MESVNVQPSLAPCTSLYHIQDPQLREHWLHVPTHTSSEDESVELEKSKDSQALHHSTIIEHDVCSLLSNHSSRHQLQDQQQHREGQNQLGSRHSSGFGSGSKRCPGSLNATSPPCCPSYDRELALLAADCSGSSSPCHLHQVNKVEPVGSS